MNIEDVRKLNNEELLNEKESILKTIMENRFKHKSMQLSDTSQINKLRKDKARIMTVINERKITEQLEIDEKENQEKYRPGNRMEKACSKIIQTPLHHSCLS